jgi:hypothetical protein
MTKKQKSAKAGSPRKASKTQVAKKAKTAPARERDPRLPAAGTTLTRSYKGEEYRVKVLAEGFEYEGKPFRSLTALAREITGYPAISGPAWWGIAEGSATPESAADAPPAAKPRAPKTRRAGRDPNSAATPATDAAAAESATA